MQTSFYDPCSKGTHRPERSLDIQVESGMHRCLHWRNTRKLAAGSLFCFFQSTLFKTRFFVVVNLYLRWKLLPTLFRRKAECTSQSQRGERTIRGFLDCMSYVIWAGCKEDEDCRLGWGWCAYTDRGERRCIQGEATRVDSVGGGRRY